VEISPPPPENRAVNDIMWKYFVEPDRSQMTIWLIRIAFWIPKATNTQSEHASVLHYTYIACILVYVG